MAAKKNSEAVPASPIDVNALIVGVGDMQVTMNDVISIGVQQVEDALSTIIKEHTAAAVRLDKEVKEITDACDKQNAYLVSAEVADKAKALKAPVEAFGGSVRVKVTAGTTWHDAVGRPNHTATVTVCNPKGGEVSFYVTRSYDDGLLARLAEAGRLSEQAAQERAIVVDARRQKADLNSTERTLRAGLARRALESKQGGKELLDLLLGDVQRQIAVLPGR